MPQKRKLQMDFDPVSSYQDWRYSTSTWCSCFFAPLPYQITLPASVLDRGHKTCCKCSAWPKQALSEGNVEIERVPGIKGLMPKKQSAGLSRRGGGTSLPLGVGSGGPFFGAIGKRTRIGVYSRVWIRNIHLKSCHFSAQFCLPVRGQGSELLGI